MFYAINLRTRITQHQGDRQSCRQYVRNIREMGFNNDPFAVVQGAKTRDAILKGADAGRYLHTAELVK